MIELNNIIKYKLNNGLKVILYSDKSIPEVAVNLWYDVGSANEEEGKTGLAHLCEHLMFQGSLNVPKEAHFKYIEEAGGRLNGSTSQDRTNYYESLPANNLELALWLESDRMGFLLPALDEEKFNNQLSVVINERKQRYDNTPYGRTMEIIFSNMFPKGHPYNSPVIGWQEDLEKLTLDVAKDFISKYYSPSNASLVIAGNFEVEEAKELVELYFGEFKTTENIPQINVSESKLSENKSFNYYDEINLPVVYYVWHTDKEFTDESFALNIAADILSSSKTKHLYKKLIYDKKISVYSAAVPLSLNKSGLFLIGAYAHDMNVFDDVKSKIWEVINDVIKNKFEDSEIRRYLNKYKSAQIFSYQKIELLANRMNFYEKVLGTPNGFAYEEQKIKEFDADKVTDYFVKCIEKPYFELNILPKGVKNDN